MDNIVATPEIRQPSGDLIDRALVTAHLLTGNLRQAEEAALEAISSWNPAGEPEEVLFQNVVGAAARTQPEQSLPASYATGSYLPRELNTVLELAPALRRCFVLRILVGLPSQACARLLRLRSDEVEEYTGAALRCLAAA